MNQLNILFQENNATFLVFVMYYKLYEAPSIFDMH